MRNASSKALRACARVAVERDGVIGLVNSLRMTTRGASFAVIVIAVFLEGLVNGLGTIALLAFLRSSIACVAVRLLDVPFFNSKEMSL